MTVMHNQILLSLSESVLDGIARFYPENKMELDEIYSLMGEPPNLKMGHVAFPCFSLALHQTRLQRFCLIMGKPIFKRAELRPWCLNCSNVAIPLSLYW